MDVEVISKATGAVTRVASDTVDLNAPSIVRLNLTRADVVGFERQGNTLVVRLANGEQVQVAGFYPEGAAVAPHDLVLRENDGSLWQARVAPGAPRFTALQDLDELLATGAAGGESSLALPLTLLGGVAAAGAVAAVASGGGGNDAPDGNGTTPPTVPPVTGTPTPDTTPPAVPTAAIDGRGTAVTGRGEAGATVTIRDGTGAVIGRASCRERVLYRV